MQAIPTNHNATESQKALMELDAALASAASGRRVEVASEIEIEAISEFINGRGLK
jgi:hypothetical protein